jgi:menaquinol-cytochrome c reductase cytochrome b/c subunit
MTVHLMFWAVLVMIGSFFRGPGFNFTLPWKDGLFFEL